MSRFTQKLLLGYEELPVADLAPCGQVHNLQADEPALGFKEPNPQRQILSGMSQASKVPQIQAEQKEKQSFYSWKFIVLTLIATYFIKKHLDQFLKNARIEVSILNGMLLAQLSQPR